MSTPSGKPSVKLPVVPPAASLIANVTVKPTVAAARPKVAPKVPALSESDTLQNMCMQLSIKSSQKKAKVEEKDGEDSTADKLLAHETHVFLPDFRNDVMDTPEGTIPIRDCEDIVRYFIHMVMELSKEDDYSTTELTNTVSIFKSYVDQDMFNQDHTYAMLNALITGGLVNERESYIVHSTYQGNTLNKLMFDYQFLDRTLSGPPAKMVCNRAYFQVALDTNPSAYKSQVSNKPTNTTYRNMHEFCSIYMRVQDMAYISKAFGTDSWSKGRPGDQFFVSITNRTCGYQRIKVSIANPYKSAKQPTMCLTPGFVSTKDGELEQQKMTFRSNWAKLIDPFDAARIGDTGVAMERYFRPESIANNCSFKGGQGPVNRSLRTLARARRKIELPFGNATLSFNMKESEGMSWIIPKIHNFVHAKYTTRYKKQAEEYKGF